MWDSASSVFSEPAIFSVGLGSVEAAFCVTAIFTVFCSAVMTIWPTWASPVLSLALTVSLSPSFEAVIHSSGKV